MYLYCGCICPTFTPHLQFLSHAVRISSSEVRTVSFAGNQRNHLDIQGSTFAIAKVGSSDFQLRAIPVFVSDSEHKMDHGAICIAVVNMRAWAGFAGWQERGIGEKWEKPHYLVDATGRKEILLRK